MIHVRRTAPPPESLQSDGALELAAWRAFIAAGAKGKKPSFKAYKRPEVRKALEDMFHGKCAYCESFIGHISSTDVEHWRPKGRVVTESGALLEGYWWLAAEWTNLFPACPHCNRPTTHALPGGGKTAGKGMRFPLTPARQKSPAEGDELSEEPLLLNPSDLDRKRAPERHLEFASELEKDGLIRASDDGAGGDDPLGASSIATYGLNRGDLVLRRAQLAKDIRLAMETIDNAVLNLDQLPRGSEAHTRQLGLIDAQRKRLEERLSEEAEYLLLARQLVRPYLRKLKRRLKR